MFYTQRFRHNRANNINLSTIKGEFVVLTEDDWNDYGFETTFWLDVWKDGEFFEVGLIRILHISEEATRRIIPQEFEELTDDYISLGYSEQFYKNIVNVLGRRKAMKILTKLNDIALIGLEENKNFNLEHKGIEDSFFRSSDGRFLFSDVKDKYFLDKGSQDRDYKFTFNAKLYPDSEDFKEINIDFRKKDSYLPNRLFTIVGKNGVGKTRLLNQLAESLFDSSKPENRNRFIDIEKTGISKLDEKMPIYNKIIAISFSVFDKFYKGTVDGESDSRKNEESEEQTKFNNYTYIGLHKVDNSIYSSNELIEINKRAYKKILDNNRQSLFIDAINSSNILNYKLKEDFEYDAFFTEIFSSGQSIFISMLCRLLSEIEDGSLIFLDEPELYLHPNAIASLARIYYDILEKFKSYAILCTHSPILVQEIPSKYVRKLFITDDSTIHYLRPNIETFGNNISDITANIFNVLDGESLYKSKLIKWSKDENLDEDKIIDLFDNGLSLKAQLYLASLFEGE